MKYTATRIVDLDQDPCVGCSLSGIKDGCSRVPLRRYDAEGQLADPDDPVDLLVVGDVPTVYDHRRAQYLGDEDGKTILSGVKDLGLKSFAIIPSVRCWARGEVNHFMLPPEFRKGWGEEAPVQPFDHAKEAVVHCKEYVTRARAALQPKVTLALGSFAAEALGLGNNVKRLRSTPIHPNPGLAAASQKEGIVVTWDRVYTRTSRWAGTDLWWDIDHKLPGLLTTGYSTPRGDSSTVEHIILDTVAKVERFVDDCLNDADVDTQDLLSFDFETDGLARSKSSNRILNVGFSFTSDEDTAYVVPLMHPETPFSGEELDMVMAALGRLWRAKGARFYGFLAHNAQFETEMIKVFWDIWIGEDGGKPILDTLILAYLADENRHKTGIKKPYSLETLALEYLGFRWYSETKIKGMRDRLAEEKLTRVNQYVGYDAAVTARLCNHLFEVMAAEGSIEDLIKVAVHLYAEATLYTSDMTLTGQRIDIELLRMLRADDSAIVHRLAEIRKTFDNSPKVKKAVKIALEKLNQKRKNKVGLVGLKPMFKTSATDAAAQFNLNSPEHLRALFSDVMKLPGAQKSVAKEWQDRYKDRHELVALFQEYQSLSKLDSAYLQPIAMWVQQSDDGRLHPSFNLSRTTSGRLSASEPNTQQVPRTNSRAKKQIKSLYCAGPGNVLIQLDFSQAEVRWLGILSGDKNLRKKYEVAESLKKRLLEDPDNEELQRAILIEGDLHMSTAIDMYKLDQRAVLDELGEYTKLAKNKRQAAKSICFGLIYGKHYKSLARDLGIEVAESKDTVDKWMSQFPQAAAWLKNVDDTIAKTCVSRSPFGRWRRLPEAKSVDNSVANRAKRQARNTPIQSAASDFCIYAACELRKRLRDDPRMKEVRIVNTVHDSLIAEMPADPKVIRRYSMIAKEVFTDPNLIEKHFGVVPSVPLAVDFEGGINWGNMKGYDMSKKSLKRVIFDANVLSKQPAGTVFDDLVGKGLLYDERGLLSDEDQPEMKPPAVKNSETSHAAADDVQNRTKAMRTEILKLLRSKGTNGMTCDEVEVTLNMKHQTASARIAELSQRGRIVKVGKRLTRSGSKANVYLHKVHAETFYSAAEDQYRT